MHTSYMDTSDINQLHLILYIRQYPGHHPDTPHRQTLKVFLQKCGPFSLSAGGGGCPDVLLQHSIPLSAHSTFVTLTSFPHTARMFTGNKECSTSPQSSSLQFWLYLASTDRAYILSSLFMLEPFIH